MKNFDPKPFFLAVATVVVGLTVFEVGKKQLNRFKTTPPAVTTETEI